MLRVPALQIFEQSSSVVGEAKQIVTGFQQVEGKQLIFLFIVIILQFSHSLQMSLNGSTLTDSESTLIGSSSLTGSESTLTGSNSSLNGSGFNESHSNLNGSTKTTSNGSKSILNGSVKSFNGSYSTLNGSVKSSKSSGTFFGSCHSSTSIGTFKTIGSSETIGTYKTIGSSETIGTFKTAKSSETIGSFRTAHSGSLSTIYFSTKSYNEDDPDSNTLNWTMNYNSFDELSDTSTLIGDHPETEELREDTYLQNLCQTTEESGSTMTLNELEELSGTEDFTVTTAESENTEELNHSYQSLQDNQQPKRPEIITILEKDTILNLCLILTASVISVSIHLIFAYAQVTTTTWILIFWRAILQITISSGVLIWTLKSRRDRLKNINLRMHIMIGFLGFISIMFWLDISQKNLLTSRTSSIVYFVIPIIVFMAETIVRRTIDRRASSIAILLLWSSALLTFSTQSDSKIPWQIYSLDPTFAWPIPLGDQIKEDVLLGHVLSTFAIAATVSYLLVISFDNGFGWASIMLLQGLGGLFASLIGKIETRFRIFKNKDIFCRVDNV